MAATWKVILGSIAFVIFWLLAVFPKVKWLPIGRTAGTLVSAFLMVLFQVLSPREAFDSIDLPILALLFGTMIVSNYLERVGGFKYLRYALTWRSRGGRDLLVRVCLLSGLMSSVLTNDTACVALTPFVLSLCHSTDLPPQPYLLALATSANIGSAATPIGNPQNVIIAVQGNIPFLTFLGGVLPAVVVGLALNIVGLLALYWRRLGAKPGVPESSVDKGMKEREGGEGEQEMEEGGGKVLEGSEGEGQERSGNGEEMFLDASLVVNGKVGDDRAGEVELGGRGSSWKLPADAGGSGATGNPPGEASGSNLEGSLRNNAVGEDCRGSGEVVDPSAVGRVTLSTRSKRHDWWFRIGVFVVTAGMMACFLAGLDLAWTAVGAALAMVAMDFVDANPVLDKVSYSLLVFFSGMFISVEGFNATDLPGDFWDAVEPHARLDSASGTALMSAVVTLLSNIASNVPTVLLLGPRLAASAAATPGVSVTRSWLLLAWVSTVAGNLTLLGSAANIIVSEEARRDERHGYKLSFWNHLRFGFPSTVIIIAVGVCLVRG